MPGEAGLQRAVFIIGKVGLQPVAFIVFCDASQRQLVNRK